MLSLWKDADIKKDGSESILWRVSWYFWPIKWPYSWSLQTETKSWSQSDLLSGWKISNPHIRYGIFQVMEPSSPVVLCSDNVRMGLMFLGERMAKVWKCWLSLNPLYIVAYTFCKMLKVHKPSLFQVLCFRNGNLWIKN